MSTPIVTVDIGGTHARFALAEIATGGALAYVQDGDVIKLCGHDGLLQVKADLSGRTPVSAPRAEMGMGRELFALLRNHADGAEEGASAILAEAGL